MLELNEFSFNKTDYIEHWRIKGKYFGYPDCCIEEFCNVDFDKRTKEQDKVHDGTGFIPCAIHAEMIYKGSIKLKDLIKNREEPLPFPNETQLK